jgi:hypothetical protein
MKINYGLAECYAIGYAQGHDKGQFEHDAFEHMTDAEQMEYRIGYAQGVTDYGIEEGK